MQEGCWKCLKSIKGGDVEACDRYHAKMTVLIVDDSSENIAVLSSLLRGFYRTKIATTGEKALQIALSNDPPDLVLLDIMMPGIDGYEVCRRLKTDKKTAHIPVIFLTAKTGIGDEEKGLELGAVDYIAKPISPPIVLARVKTHLQLKMVRDFFKDRSEFLEAEVSRRTREISMIQDVSMVAMGSLAEARDNETGNHIRRTQHYVKLLTTKLKDHPNFKDFLADETINMLLKSAPLHDIGKVGIPDSILLKKNQLTSEEFEIMKKHTIIGRDAITNAEKVLDAPFSFLKHAREIAYSHHEKWDGTGYPEGLSGDDIPISGRIMAIVDVYDALISSRVYKWPMPHDLAVQTIREGKGTHFDPDIVEAFLEISDQFSEFALLMSQRDVLEEDRSKESKGDVTDKHSESAIKEISREDSQK
jgi:putative two-component system response regulator